MAENIALLDADRAPLGKIVPRGTALQDGEHLLVVHVCIFNRSGEQSAYGQSAEKAVPHLRGRELRRIKRQNSGVCMRKFSFEVFECSGIVLFISFTRNGSDGSKRQQFIGTIPGRNILQHVAADNQKQFGGFGQVFMQLLQRVDRVALSAAPQLQIAGFHTVNAVCGKLGHAVALFGRHGTRDALVRRIGCNHQKNAVQMQNIFCTDCGFHMCLVNGVECSAEDADTHVLWLCFLSRLLTRMS